MTGGFARRDAGRQFHGLRYLFSAFAVGFWGIIYLAQQRLKPLQTILALQDLRKRNTKGCDFYTR